jgi:hypothetical protein
MKMHGIHNVPSFCERHGNDSILRFLHFCRIHSSIRVTPAMEAKIADYVWELSELLA